MNIVVYCQHVLGVGHFFRTLEICRALDRHRVRLISGGPPLEAQLPPHVAEVRLPALHMDPEFKALRAEPGSDAETVLRERRDRLLALLAAEPADLFIVELYPFGRKAFRVGDRPAARGHARGAAPALRCGLQRAGHPGREGGPAGVREPGRVHAQPVLRRRADPRGPGLRAPPGDLRPRGGDRRPAGLHRLRHAGPGPGRAATRARRARGGAGRAAGGGERRRRQCGDAAARGRRARLRAARDSAGGPPAGLHRAVPARTGVRAAARARGRPARRSSGSAPISCRCWPRPTCRSAWRATTPR